MLIQTRDFGDIEIPEEEIITFPIGIYGFEDIHRFVILSDGDQTNPFMWLQAVDYVEPCFIVIDPIKLDILDEPYEPVLSENFLRSMGLVETENLRMVSMATIRQPIHDSTINLASPIIINSAKNIAAQILLENAQYSLHYPLFPEKIKGE